MDSLLVLTQKTPGLQLNYKTLHQTMLLSVLKRRKYNRNGDRRSDAVQNEILVELAPAGRQSASQ